MLNKSMMLLKTGNYDAVVHCAAWTAVDKAEEPELFDKVRAVNATGTQNIVNVCKELNIPIMYFQQIMYLMDKVLHHGMNMMKDIH